MEPLLTKPDQARVLHVDDREPFLDVAEMCLEQETDELIVTSKTDPVDGLEYMKHNRVDCIVSDYDMHEMDGLEFLSEVRDRDNGIPFVLFTGKGSEEVAARAIEAGVDSYLRKRGGRAQFAVLVNRIETLVDKAWTRRHAEKIEETYELIAKTATDAFWIRDMETEETLYSEGIGRFGYEPGVREEGFEWWVDRVHPEDREESRDLNTLQREGAPRGFDDFDGELGKFTYRYRWRCADGEYVRCISRGIVRFQDDEPVEMVGAMTTEEKLPVPEP